MCWIISTYPDMARFRLECLFVQSVVVIGFLSISSVIMGPVPLQVRLTQKKIYSHFLFLRVPLFVIYFTKIFLSLTIAYINTNSVDSDEMLHYAASHLSLHCQYTNVYASRQRRIKINTTYLRQ